ncbi:MAG TPA: site-specific integrase [Steroidobacteraceae bacterium]|nr:site-specific integrase [Steroidobacteraceae bacterium]
MARKRRRAKRLARGYTIRERDGRYTAQVRVKTREKFFDRGKTFASEAEAEAWAQSLVAELRKQSASGARKDLTQLTVGDLIRAFLEEPTTKHQKSYEDTRRLLEWWLNKFGNVRLLDFGAMTLREEARPLLMKGRSGATVNRYMMAMRAAWSFGRIAGYVLPERLWPDGLKLPEPKGIVRYLSPAELDRLLKAADSNPMMRAAIEISLCTGLRQGELLRLTWKDIDFDRARVTSHETKNDEIKVSALVPEAIEAFKRLKALPVVSLTHPFVINDRRKKMVPLDKNTLLPRWNKIRKAAKFDNRFRWHDLRHSCASYLAQNGATPLEIAEVMGHKTLAMVKRYAHLVGGKAVTGQTKIGEMLKGGTAPK